MPGNFGGRPAPLPKPYDFSRFPRQPVQRAAPPGHDTYTVGALTGTLFGAITALSPVHIATGNLEVTGRQNMPLVRAQFRVNGVPAIPATSLKGAVRSVVEAISSPPSCLRATSARADTLPQGAGPCREKERLCIACRMFGALGYLGRIRFRDALLTSGATAYIKLPSMFAPRSRENAYYDGRLVRGRKFYLHGLEDGRPAGGPVPVEACPVGSIFQFALDFDNVSRDELSLLLCALGQGSPKLWLKLGSGKPACCGSVRVDIERVEAMTGLETEFDLVPVPVDVAGWAAGSKAVDGNRLDELAEILRFPGPRECPAGNY